MMVVLLVMLVAVLPGGRELLLGLEKLLLGVPLAFALASWHRPGQPIGVDCIAALDAG
jgi:hypothetical protein